MNTWSWPASAILPHESFMHGDLYLATILLLLRGQGGLSADFMASRSFHLSAETWDIVLMLRQFPWMDKEAVKVDSSPTHPVCEPE